MNKNYEDTVRMIINANKFLFLNQKEHIKKYYKARRIHSSILTSMHNYIESGKFPAVDYFNTINNDIVRETKALKVGINNSKEDEALVFNELFMYKNHYKIPSLTEIYIKNKKFKDQDKIKMLYAMNDSVAGLFKIVSFDSKEGYVTYQDVFTNKRYKIIDVAMSSIGGINNKSNEEFYIYNRVMNYDGIRFAIGIPLLFSSKNKRLKDFIKHHKYKNCSDFSRCIMLFDIYKNTDDKIVKVENNSY